MKSKTTLLQATLLLTANMIITTISIAQVTQEWVSRYNGTGNGEDAAYSLAVDGSGNVYVTGSSGGINDDYATIKYDSLGVQLWEARYDGPGNWYDGANSIAVDGSGYVYVTGESGGSGSTDYATIKYNSSGVQQWEARYNGPGNGNDGALSLAVDSSGNVYVTGWSLGSGTSWDYATIKYNSAGVQQWVQRYNGPGNGGDGGHSLAVDGSGNVYVTGDSYGNGTDVDYATIKYNSSGVQQWVSRYNGPGNNIDNPWSLAVDGSGNVYVTGKSGGSGTGYDYGTIKYNSVGDTLWVARYSGPGNSEDMTYSLAVDGSGNVYVTGGSGGDYATIKYNLLGDTLWVARYNGPANNDDAASSLAVDDSGNVYVTGYTGGTGTSQDYATIKYNSLGDSVWVSRYNGPGNSYDYARSIAVDGLGNVFVTGSSTASYENDYATIKYNSLGDSLWVARYNYYGPVSGFDSAYSISVDSSGNVYVTGESGGDYATIKYNSLGDTLWVARYNGPGNAEDRATSLAIDGSGNVYVTGESVGSGTGYDYSTIKYNSFGVQQWVSRYNGPGNDEDRAYSLAIDGLGNVYVTGQSIGNGTYNDYATIKYNSLGDTLWVARYNGPGNSYDGASSLAVDGSDNVYITGYSHGIGTYRDYATIKYNSLGDTLWVARYNGPTNNGDAASSLAVDGSGNVYVTGDSYVGSGFGEMDYATIKYNSSGVQQWVAIYNGPGNWYDDARSLAVDGSGNVYVTGGSAAGGGIIDYATLKYNSSGVQQWVERYYGGGGNGFGAYSLAVDGTGNVYVTGTSHGGPGSYDDYVTIKYNSLGDSLWVQRYDGPGNVGDAANAIAVDGTGNVYVTGFSASGGQFDYATIKYSQIMVGIPPISNEIPAAFLLVQNYPNPFSGSTVISFSLSQSQIVSLKVFDVNGRLVSTLADQIFEAGENKLIWNAEKVHSGIYFLRMETAGYSENRKLIVAK